MRTALLITVTALAGLAARAALATAPPATVSCDSAAMFTEPPKPGGDERVVFGRVAVPPRDLAQVAHVDGPWPYWRKAGLLVRAGTTGVVISVPRVWRSRVAISWGDSGVVPALRVARCSSPPNEWNVYTGGFYLRRPACVPLTVRVGKREKQVRFGVGRTC